MRDWESIRGALTYTRLMEIVYHSRRPTETYAEYILRRLEWEERREPEIERDRR